MKRINKMLGIGLFICMAYGSEMNAQSLVTSEIKGKGKPIILIHGLYCSGEVWKEVVAHYQDKYECHILTLAGFGGKTPVIRDGFLEAVKDQVNAYVKSQGLKRPIILGHSMGGFIALWAASSAPGLYSKVIAVDGLPFLPAISMPGATIESSKPMAENIKKSMMDQTPEQIEASQRQYLPMMITDPQRVDQVVKLAVKADPNTQAEVMYEMFTIDLRKTISSIECPVLVMGAWIAYSQYGATHDSVLKGYQEQMASVKNCKIELNDTSKHFIFYDAPDWFYLTIDSFVRSTP